MRAVRMVAPRKMEIVEIEVPEISQGQVLVRLLRNAICGSDLITFLETQPRRYPGELGSPCHECAGVVEKSFLDGFEPGDRVLYFPPPVENGLREYVAADAHQLLKLPAEGDLSELVLAQLLGTVLRTTREIGSVLGQSVAVSGQGPVGQLVDRVLWNLGAKQVIGIDSVPERLRISPLMGATAVVDATARQPWETVSRLTGGKGADLVIEAAGYEETQRLMIELVRQDGRIVMFGVPKYQRSELDLFAWYKKRAQMVTYHVPDVERDIALALQFIVEKRVDVKPILTHAFPLTRVQEAYDLFADRREGCVKVILEMDR